MLLLRFVFIFISFLISLTLISDFVTAMENSAVDVTIDVHISKNNETLNYKIETLPNSHTLLGEGPHWDVERQSLYFVDINAATLLRYDYHTNEIYRCKIVGEELASFIIPVEGTTDKFAVGCGRRVVIVTWDGYMDSCTVEGLLFEVQQETRFNNNRINDGKCDSYGRLFTGTMLYKGDVANSRLGEFYKYDQTGAVEVIKSNIGVSNGMAWNDALGKFYYIDSTDFEVKEYDYDCESGSVRGSPKSVFNLKKTDGVIVYNIFPDGMTIDTEGNLYVATFNGHTVYKVNPRTGKVLLEIKFPCIQITSVAFGGPNLDTLFVTTASTLGDPEPAGNTFKVTGLGAKGLPMNKLLL